MKTTMGKEKILNQLETIVEDNRDLNAYLTIAKLAFNIGVSESIKNCDKNCERNRQELEDLKFTDIK